MVEIMGRNMFENLEFLEEEYRKDLIDGILSSSRGRKYSREKLETLCTTEYLGFLYDQLAD